MDAPKTSPDRASTRAVLALVFGILGIVHLVPCAAPIAAILLGMGEPSGIARAGVILGWITLAQYALIAGLALLIVLLGGWAALPFVG
jgi:cytochrome c biogenesis protein CcdA